MKKIVFFLFLIQWFIMDVNHSWAQEPIINYLPIQVGNTWYYDHPDSLSNPWDILMISDTVNINQHKYYLWSRGSGVNVMDTIFRDDCYNVYRYEDGKTHLWFDFSLDSGSVYTYGSFGPDHLGYDVHVSKDISVKTPSGSYTQCVGLFFDIPQVIDEEHLYIFAPDVGLILEQANGWWQNVLHDYSLNPDHTVVHGHGSMVKNFVLYQNYPNPFNPSTMINYQLQINSHVELSVYNLLGQKIITLVSENQPPGSHTVGWDGYCVPGGVYFCRLQAGRYQETIKMMLIR